MEEEGFSMMQSPHPPLLLKEKNGRVVTLTLNRPQVLNALSWELIQQLVTALEDYDKDPDISVVILTGHKEFFAVGADLHELAKQTYPQAYFQQSMLEWQKIAAFRKPLIAAISGYAFGGGCELALMCDVLIAAENAIFSQPEVFLGTPPGGGATQRLPRVMGKARAMDLCLTGRRLTALEAEKWGLVSRVVPTGQLKAAALSVAQRMEELSLPVLMMVKEAVLQSTSGPLQDGLRLEFRLFEAACALEDRREGIQAFLEKRAPIFQNK